MQMQKQHKGNIDTTKAYAMSTEWRRITVMYVVMSLKILALGFVESTVPPLCFDEQ